MTDRFHDKACPAREGAGDCTCFDPYEERKERDLCAHCLGDGIDENGETCAFCRGDGEGG